MKKIPHTGAFGLLSIVIALLIFIMNGAHAQLPAGFSQSLVANGISNPTVMAFAPDGRIFVAQQNGQLRVIKNGALLTKPFVTLSVNSSGERGLLGIAFDPNFASNQFIYLYYTLSTAANNRISRFTASGDTALSPTGTVILNLDPLSSATNHNGGTIQFGLDGKLYVGVGENANTLNSQNLDTYHGKILRINPDGTVPTGNPFTGGTAQRMRVWEYGMRNPYTLSVQPGTGKIFVNDVGQSAWEEVNDCSTGGLNYGWPSAEGNSTNPAYTNPVYTYMHGSGTGQGCAITGGTFFNPASTNYPASYVGRYFFFDYCGNWLDMLAFNGSAWVRTNFGTGLNGSPVGIVTGTDGNLYYLSRANSAVYRIVYNSGSAPVITQQPQSQTVSQGNPVTFTVAASGTAPLSYQWRKNAVAISGATLTSYTIASVTTGDAGNYSVVVSNASGSTTSNNATLTVTAPNQAPTATIQTPVAGALFSGGSVINFSGTGSDPEDVTVPASRFTWWVNFHHDTHTHPGPTLPSGVTSGSFTIPNSGETSANVFYRLYLRVQDSQGASDTSFTDILPRTSVVNITTNPPGLQITVDGQPFTSPYSFTGVEGMLRTIGATSPQTFSGRAYTFSNWSQGGTQTQTFATPVNDATYTARFDLVLTADADAYVRAGSGAGINYGSATVLSTKNAGVNSSKTNETYIRFDITSFTASLSSAKLRLFGRLSNSSVSSVAVEVHEVTTQTWQENTITWNNKPAPQAAVLASASVSGTTGTFYEWDLTSFIIAKKNAGNLTVTLLLRNTSTSGSARVDFNSKEAGSSIPQLVVLSTAPPPVAGGENQMKESPKSSGIVSLYPNPSAGIFYLDVSVEYLNSVISVYDINGKQVYQSVITNNHTAIVPEGWKRGVYLCKVEGESSHYSIRMVVE